MKKMVFVDLDNTLVKGQSQQLFIRYLFKKNKIPFRFMMKIYVLFFLWKIYLIRDVISIRKNVYRAFAGWEVNEVKIMINDFFESELKNLFYPQALEIVTQHIKRNDEIVIVSGSINLLLEVIKNYIGVNYYISTILEEKNGKLTGGVCNLIPYGENKIELVKKFLIEHKFSLENSYAYTDHVSDFTFLKLVTYPRVVNPDTKLRKIAKRNNWPILIFN